MELQSSDEAMSHSRARIKSNKLEKRHAALESLTKEKKLNNAVFRTGRKMRLLESFRRSERELNQSIEEKDNLAQCLTGRLGTNQLSVESISLRQESRT